MDYQGILIIQEVTGGALKLLVNAVIICAAILVFVYIKALIGEPAEEERRAKFSRDLKLAQFEDEISRNPLWQTPVLWHPQVLAGIKFEARLILKRNEELSSKLPDADALNSFNIFMADEGTTVMALSFSEYKEDVDDLQGYVLRSIEGTKSNKKLSNFRVSTYPYNSPRLSGILSEVVCEHGREEMQFSSLAFYQGDKLWHFLIGGEPSNVSRDSQRIFSSIELINENPNKAQMATPEKPSH